MSVYNNQMIVNFWTKDDFNPRVHTKAEIKHYKNQIRLDIQHLRDHLYECLQEEKKHSTKRAFKK